MVGNGAQIIGKVNPDLSIKVLNAVDLGSNVGMYYTLYYTYFLTVYKSVIPFRIGSDVRAYEQTEHTIRSCSTHLAT